MKTKLIILLSLLFIGLNQSLSAGCMYELLDLLHVIAIDEEILRKGLKSKHKDFEDALQMLCAYSVEKMVCVVTRNTRDFKDCELPVLTPDEFIEKR